MKSNTYIFSLTVVIAFLLTGDCVFSQPKNDSLDKKLMEICVHNKIPGLSVIIANTDSILYRHSFGYADIKKKLPFTTQTIENIGSVSKTFIACAIMKSIEQGYFTLETSLNDILSFKVVNPYHPNDEIRIMDLVTQTSGIIDNQTVYKNCYKFRKEGPYSRLLMLALRLKGYSGKVTDTCLKDFFYNYLSVNGKWYSKKNFSVRSPGKQFNYSNIASALAAYLIEIRSGMTFAAYTQKYILEPLMMTHSCWFIDSTQKNHFARLYYNASLTFPLYTLVTYPDGGLRTSSDDLSNYLISLIKGYNGNDNILKKESFKAMFTPMLSDTSLEGIDLHRRNMGVFWNIYKNGTIVKDGDDPGVNTYLFFNTKTHIGGLFLCNKMIDEDDLVKILQHYAAH